jgi:alkaline phosphatase D
MAELHPDCRRRLLRMAAAAALAAWAPRTAFSQPRLPDNPFALGVASGAPGSASVVLWTRLTGACIGSGPVPVRWEIAHDEAFARIVQQGQATALAQLAHTVHVDAHGLEPDRWYFYRFLAGGWASPVGRTRTLPAADAAVARLRIGYASCQRWEHGYFAAWRHLRAEQPDLVVFLGDYIYEYPGARAAVRSVPGFWATTLDDYRRRHALYKSDADLQAMHAACPWLLTWDDHEVQNDYAGLQAGDSGPPWGDFAARRAAAYQAYYEHMPLPASAFTRALQGLAGGAELRLYSQHRFGRLAALHLLDLRQYRSPQACTPGGRTGAGEVDPQACAALADPRRSLLGAAQEQWLEAQLAAGGATWTVLAQSTLFGQRDVRNGPGRLFWNDGWDGYPAARRRLTDALQTHRVGNAVLLGGDVHQNWVGHVKQDYERAESASLGVEFCGTSITSRETKGAAAAVPRQLAKNPHFTFADAQHRGYGLAEFTPARLQVNLRVLDDVARPDANVRTLARFAVEAGRAQVERA